jgi:hypothetical protein
MVFVVQKKIFPGLVTDNHDKADWKENRVWQPAQRHGVSNITKFHFVNKSNEHCRHMYFYITGHNNSYGAAPSWSSSISETFLDDLAGSH